jgi:hypothetical protein
MVLMIGDSDVDIFNSRMIGDSDVDIFNSRSHASLIIQSLTR